ncbi:hypothetical protein E2C01_051904 [Portunus trituberculatus]|uniref:Uncharacterized protein n=1 Tax=Portunus trituberculatus TaxID=210409 RepID=A0A5B7GMZ3_PORTR|nr:hypothetical protein [Portunus trituberculatus]
MQGNRVLSQPLFFYSSPWSRQACGHHHPPPVPVLLRSNFQCDVDSSLVGVYGDLLCLVVLGKEGEETGCALAIPEGSVVCRREVPPTTVEVCIVTKVWHMTYASCVGALMFMARLCNV